MRATVLVMVLFSRAYAGESALYEAAKAGDEAAVTALLAQKVEVDEPNTSGWTPLYIAAYKGHAGVVQKLLDAGADANHADSPGFTPLLQAARFGHLPVVELLVAKKAKIDARPTGSNYQGHTILHLTIADRKDEVTRWLLARGAEVNAKDPRGTTPLMVAVRKGNREIVRALLEKKAEVGATDKNGDDALAMSAMAGQAEIAELLLAAGAPADRANQTGATPLFHAAHGGHAAIIKLLLAKKAAANVRDPKSGDTALFRAAQGGRTEVVKLLLDAGVPADEANSAGETPLMAAAGNGAVPVIEILLARGADKDRKDEKGRSPVMRAQKNGHSRAAALLEAKGAAVSPEERKEANAIQRDRWFRDETIKACRMLDIKNVGLERCALSEPLPAGARRFRLTLRDMSRLEPGDKQKADHVLVAGVEIAVQRGEYVDVDAVGHFALGDRLHLVYVPVVKGTPAAFTDGRIVTYLFDEAAPAFKIAWRSAACGAGCTAQEVSTLRRGSALQVEIRQGERRTRLGWDPQRRALVPAR